jgi:excisionase family DNA binding protein
MGEPASLLIDQAAAFLGVSRRTVYYRIQEGLLITVRTRCGSQRVLVESLERQRRAGRRRRRLRPGADPSTAPAGDSESEALAF